MKVLCPLNDLTDYGDSIRLLSNEKLAATDNTYIR